MDCLVQIQKIIWVFGCTESLYVKTNRNNQKNQ